MPNEPMSEASHKNGKDCNPPLDWQPGEEGWTPDGRQARYVAKSPDDLFVVQMAHELDVWDGEEDDSWEDQSWGRFEAFAAFHRKAPAGVFDSEIAQRRETIASLEEERDRLQAEIRAASQEHAALLDKLKQVPALRRIEECLEGRVTHWAIKDYGPWKVRTSEEALSTEEGYAKKTKLVTLFGDPQKVTSFEYRISEYSDGSGSRGTSAWPFCSEEEAKAFVRDQISEVLSSAWPEYPETLTGSIGFRELVAEAKEFGVEVPERFTAWLRARDLQSAREKLEKAEGAVSEAAGELAEVEAAEP